jgi:hypothetical protein
MAQKIFIDTEFTDFIESRLISFGAVTEDGRHEFYVEITDYEKKLESRFVQLNVLPLLDNKKYGCPERHAGLKLWKWIDALPYDELEIAIDYNDDWALMLNLLSDNPPVKVLSDPFNLMQDLRVRGSIRDTADNSSGTLVHPGSAFHQATAIYHYRLAHRQYFQTHGLIPHHALSDAKAIRAGWMAANDYLLY